MKRKLPAKIGMDTVDVSKSCDVKFDVLFLDGSRTFGFNRIQCAHDIG